MMKMNMGVALPSHVIDSCNINEINGKSYEDTSFLLLESPFWVRRKALACGGLLLMVLSISVIRLMFGLGCWGGARQ